MEDFKELIEVINQAVSDLNAGIPGIQAELRKKVLLQLKELDLSGDSVKATAKNMKIVGGIKNQLNKLILNPKYTAAVKNYAHTFNQISKLQNKYFSSVENKFSPPALGREMEKLAVQGVVKSLTSGIDTNISEGIADILRKGVSTAKSYTDLQGQLDAFITGTNGSDGQLLRYTKQIATDAINQFSGEYTQLISNDLGYEWFRYSGSNIATTRPWCLACRDRMFFHISELAEVIKGNFPEFEKHGGKIYDKTGLPSGMIEGTDLSNFMVNRGGYNCGHQWRPVSERMVPVDIKTRVYASMAYKMWKGEAAPKENKKPDVETGKANTNKKSIANLLKDANDDKTLDKTFNAVVPFTKPIIDGLYKLSNAKSREKALTQIFHDEEMKELHIYNPHNVLAKIHPNHKKANVHKAIEIAGDLIQNRRAIALLPEDNEIQSPDAVVDFKGKKYISELKIFTTKKSNTIAPEIIDGFIKTGYKKNPGHVTIKIINADLNIIDEAIQQVKRSKKCVIGNITIINKYGNFKEITSAEIISDKYKKLLKGFF